MQPLNLLAREPITQSVTKLLRAHQAQVLMDTKLRNNPDSHKVFICMETFFPVVTKILLGA